MPDGFEAVDGEHGISMIANAISEQACEMAAKARISRWDLCVALANACGHILADQSKPPPAGIIMPNRGRPMPRAAALERMDALRTIMEASYDLRDVSGEC